MDKLLKDIPNGFVITAALMVLAILVALVYAVQGFKSQVLSVDSYDYVSTNVICNHGNVPLFYPDVRGVSEKSDPITTLILTKDGTLVTLPSRCLIARFIRSQEKPSRPELVADE